MKSFLLFLWGWMVLGGVSEVWAQPEKHKLNIFWVELSDKNGTPYSVFHPEEFLSPRALARRERQGIGIDESDLPVSPVYIEQVKALGGRIHAVSKWFNALAVYIPDTAHIKPIQRLPFVRSFRYLGKWREVRNQPLETKRAHKSEYKKAPAYHGHASPQARLSNMNVLHRWGHQGQGMHVAIFDGGFSNVYRAPAFDSLNQSGRLLGTHDFVDHDDFVYESSTHGTNVLATMASNLPYLIVGTAPYASYYLFKTEDVLGEFRIEEFNWVAAAERADSLGVDVINSSLGYTEFSDTTMSYKYKDIDGKTALVSRGADMAVSKGILVVNSAGNEGDGKWHYIGTPADAFNVVTVGAVNTAGKKADFSSWGPTHDGRIKPNLAAVGDNTVIASMVDYDVSAADGTSFSSPVMAGMLTSFWQMFPQKTNMEIKALAEESSSQYDSPDEGLGYGVPDFYYGYIAASQSVLLIDLKGNAFSKQTLVGKELPILIEVEKAARINIYLYNVFEQLVYQQTNIQANQEVYRHLIPDMDTLPAGVYTVLIEVNGKSYYMEVVLDPHNHR